VVRQAIDITVRECLGLVDRDGGFETPGGGGGVDGGEADYFSASVEGGKHVAGIHTVDDSSIVWRRSVCEC